MSNFDLPSSSAPARVAVATRATLTTHKLTSQFRTLMPLLLVGLRSFDVGLFPCPDFPAGRVEQALVVAFSQLLACFGCQLGEQRCVHVIDLQVACLVRGGHLVRPEQETI